MKKHWSVTNYYLCSVSFFCPFFSLFKILFFSQHHFFYFAIVIESVFIFNGCLKFNLCFYDGFVSNNFYFFLVFYIIFLFFYNMFGVFCIFVICWNDGFFVFTSILWIRFSFTSFFLFGVRLFTMINIVFVLYILLFWSAIIFCILKFTNFFFLFFYLLNNYFFLCFLLFVIGYLII